MQPGCLYQKQFKEGSGGWIGSGFALQPKPWESSAPQLFPAADSCAVRPAAAGVTPLAVTNSGLVPPELCPLGCGGRWGDRDVSPGAGGRAGLGFPAAPGAAQLCQRDAKLTPAPEEQLSLGKLRALGQVLFSDTWRARKSLQAGLALPKLELL